MEEIWKVVAVNKDYEVSNFGNVRSLKGKNKKRLLKPFPRGSRQKDADKKGKYVAVRLHIDGVQRDYPVHKLVAISFVENPNNYPIVNHKNGIRDDNRAENLEWCDYSFNMWHSYNVLKNKSAVEKAVCQYSKNGELIAEFDSAAQAERITGVDSSSIISVCKMDGNRLAAGGYVWRYRGFEFGQLKYKKTKSVIQFNKYGEQLAFFDSVKEAAKQVGISPCGITGVCSKRGIGYNYAGGFIWRYGDDVSKDDLSVFCNKTFDKINDDGLTECQYNGSRELVDVGGFDFVKVINCCQGLRDKAGGFKWRAK